MIDGVRPSLGLNIAFAVIVLVPIAFMVVRRWRKRSEEAKLQRLARNSAHPQDNPSWVKPEAVQSDLPIAYPGIETMPTAGPAVRVGFFRRICHGVAHLLDDRQPDGYSSVAPRRPDGSRTKIFFFNGNGRSR
jgi:hypothetical protein